MKSLFVTVLLSVVFFVDAYAYDFSAACPTGQVLYYSIIDAEHHYVSIECPNFSYYAPWQGFDKPMGDVEIPSTVFFQGTAYTVTAIGDHAFYSCEQLNSVSMPPTVKRVGEEAFQSDSALATVEFGENLHYIGEHAFAYSGIAGHLEINVDTLDKQAFFSCHSLSSLHIGDRVKRIDDWAFKYCALSGSITIPETLEEIGGGVFDNTFDTLYYNAIDCHNVGNNGESPFDYCDNLQKVVFGDNVKRIPHHLLKNLSNLTGSFDLPESLEVIEVSAFWGCSGLTGPLRFPPHLVSVGNSAFSGCVGITEIVFSESMRELEDNVFKNCHGLHSVTLPSYLEYVGSSVFYACNAIETAVYDVVYNSRDNSGDVFDMCYALTELTIGENVRYFEGSIASACNALSTVNYNAINCMSADPVVWYCDGVSVINVGGNVRRIPDKAFEECNFQTLNMPEGVLHIGEKSFYFCNNVTELEIPNSVRTIGKDAFTECTSLRRCVIGNGVESIPSGTFSYCSNLTEVVIGSRVGNMATDIFTYCDELTDIYVKSIYPPYIQSCFFYNPSPYTIHVPCEAEAIYRNTLGWSEFSHYESVSPEVSVASNNITSGVAEILRQPSCNDALSIVKATPVEDAEFVGWYNGALCVSEEPIYSFDAPEDVALVARFSAPWDQLNELETESVKVFPNPVTDVLHIDDDEILSIELFDLQGRCMKMVRNAAQGTNIVDVSSLLSGLYLVRIIDRNGSVTMQKIVKN